MYKCRNRKTLRAELFSLSQDITIDLVTMQPPGHDIPISATWSDYLIDEKSLLSIIIHLRIFKEWKKDIDYPPNWIPSLSNQIIYFTQWFATNFVNVIYLNCNEILYRIIHKQFYITSIVKYEIQWEIHHNMRLLFHKNSLFFLWFNQFALNNSHLRNDTDSQCPL